jgi:hypothetical protein
MRRATVSNLIAALNFLDRTPPDLVEVREALACAAKDNAQGFSGRSIDEMQSHSDGGKQSAPQCLSAAFCADLRPAITKARSSQNCAILLS